MNAQSAESLGDFRYGRYEFICRSTKQLHSSDNSRCKPSKFSRKLFSASVSPR